MKNLTKQNKIAIIGATGNVGRKIIEILIQRIYTSSLGKTGGHHG